MGTHELRLGVTRQQLRFLQSEAEETLFGGAAGGGKSFVQVIDALVFALRYSGSRQLLLRRTLTELDRSLVPVSLRLYPQAVGKYVATSHRWRFVNGSEIELGYCDADSDVTRYQSAEYDVLRFDELTHFTEYQFRYLQSRLRGVNGFPKLIRATTNPGGIGHDWVKKRYIDRLTPGRVECIDGRTRLFLPARVKDNGFLLRADKGYLKRLEQLDEMSRRALLDGDWNLTGGRFFPEFSRRTHVIPPRALPEGRRYLTIDYGLDMLAALWILVDARGNAMVYREHYESNLVVSEAAARLLAAEAPGEPVYARLAPPDLWGRRQETGRSAAEIFATHGLYFDKSVNRREGGWLAVKEFLALRPDGCGTSAPRLTVFDTCKNLIRTLESLQTDAKNPNDAATAPHELTHAPDALRGFCATVRTGEAGALIGPYDEEIGAFLAF